jgi:hypothetical protein
MVLQVGRSVFVHAGLHPEHVDHGIDKINADAQVRCICCAPALCLALVPCLTSEDPELQLQCAPIVVCVLHRAGGVVGSHKGCHAHAPLPP